ncbi:uncharacterized protein LOC131658852 [Vicia villosa]|uniref:uncharacterized protein LOC131658852 n=1 Tax=Vicia villosa TaxID=3911 RepID=UPI00273C2D5C|nr:uncharacterized protein LOC131658852 [Vicia villosa]
MARPFEELKHVNDSKELWKIVVRIHQKWTVVMKNKEHFEMILCDKEGCDIQCRVPTMYKQAFDSVLMVNSTYTISNFQTTQCVTVGKIKQLKAAQGGWYYLACHACPKFAKGDQPPYVCGAGHATETEILRYRILIDVINDGCHATFVLWDRECTELLEVTAAQMRNTLLEAGVTNPLEYPVALDRLVGLKLGFKVKWQPDWDNGTVVSIYRDEAVMLKLLHSFGQETAPSPSREAPVIKQLDESVDEAIPIEDWTVVGDIEITSDLNSQPVTPTSATKRIAPPISTEDAATSEIQQGDHSSTKLKKIIKMEKTVT